jgi:uncharacterized protein with von Willebrand factor type A (vWA) domain
MPDHDSDINEEEWARIATGPISDGTQVIAHDGYDVEAFEEAVETFTRLGRTLEGAGERLCTGPALLRDLYWSFHKSAPRAEPVAPLSPAHEINRQIVTEIMATAEWREMREIGTVGDPYASAMATIGASERAMAALTPQTVAQVNELDELSAEAERLFDEAEALQEIAAATASREQAERLKDRADRAAAEAAEKRAAAERLGRELDAAREGRERAVRRAAREGIAEAVKEVEQANEAVKAFGGGYGAGFGTGPGGSGTPGAPSAKEKLAIARQVGRSPKLRQIAAMCGRFTRLALKQQKTRVRHPPDEVTSITAGDEIQRLLAGELALLADPELEGLFHLRFTEKSLAQYDLVGHEAEGQGPIIIALDESGSMGAPCDGMTAEVWSKSVTLALLSVARLQKRDLAVIHFAADSQLKAEVFPRGEATPAEVIACASHFYNGGGTAFEPWMKKALELAGGARFEKADVICLSDGVSAVSAQVRAEWQKMRAERGMQAYSVLIGAADGAGLLDEISDAVFCLSDLRDDLPALETIFSV